MPVPARRTPLTPVPVGVRKGGQGRALRAWTPVGTLDAGILGEVDPAGLVHMAGAPWSLDWWVGAEDRWHHPGMEAAVRQGPLDDSPVRQSALRVPGGEVVQRVGGVQATAGAWSGPALVVEVENLSAVPVALALVVRPWRLDGPGAIGEVALDGADDAPGAMVAVDGGTAALLDRVPSRVVHGPAAEVAARLAAGEDAAPPPDDAWAAGGGDDLEVAFVVPLAHTATVRVLLPAAGHGPRPRSRRRRGAAAPAVPWSAPDLGAVANGWSVHGRTDPRLSAPVEAWSDLVGWSAGMLRLAGPQEVTNALDRRAARPAGPDAGARLAAVAEALAGLDASELNDAVAAALVGAQRFSGAVEPADGSDATAALLWSTGAVLGSPLGPVRAEDLVGPTAKAVRYLTRRWSPDATGAGPGEGRRLATALRALAGGLAAVDQPEVARDALALAGRLARPGEPVVPPWEPATRPASTFGAARADRDTLAVGSAGGIERLVERVPVRRGDGLADAPGEGCLGFDVAELAETRLALLDAMVGDGPTGPVLLPSWPPEWRGRPVEAHDVPTAWGIVSFALRWHGSRPALLWEVTPRLGTTGRTAPVVRAPGLDPAFAAPEWSGEALLADPARAPGAGGPGGAQAPGEGDSFA